MCSTSIDELCEILQQLLIEDANRPGRESGHPTRTKIDRGKLRPELDLWLASKSTSES